MKKNHYLVLLLLAGFGTAKAQSPGWQWARSIGGTSEDRSNALAVDAAGNMYTTGRFSGTVDFDPGPGVFNLTSSVGYDAYILKLNNQGQLVWAKALIGTSACNGASIAVAAKTNGDIFLTGFFGGTVDFDPGVGVFNLAATGGTSAFISRLDSSGNFVWARVLSGNDYVLGHSLSLDAQGNVYTAGDFWSTIDFDPGPGVFNLTALPAGALPDGFISKLDSSGDFVWAKSFRGTSDNMIQALAADDSGNVYSTGYINGTVDFDPGPGTHNVTSSFGGGSYDCFLSKLNPAGDLAWVKTMRGKWDDFGMAIALDPAGRNVYAAGNFADTVDFDPGAGAYLLSTPSSTSYSAFTWKLDSAGNFMWARATEGFGSSNAWGITVNPANQDALTTGNFSDTVDFDPGTGVFTLSSAGGADVFISNFDSTGNFAWAIGMGGTTLETGLSVACDLSGSCSFTGYYGSPSIICGADTLVNRNASGSSFDAFIARLDTLPIAAGSQVVENQKNRLSVFPNPASQSVTVLFPDCEKAELIILDITGKTIYTTAVARSHRIEVYTGDFARGIYFLQIQGNGFTASCKLMVMD